MKGRILCMLIVWVACIFQAMVFAQHVNEPDPASGNAFIDWVNDTYGADDMLVSGTVYLPPNPLIEGHPYFDSDSWFDATVYIDGRSFYQQEVKYDLALQRLILNAVFKSGGVAKIVLSSWKIDSLYLGQHLFINSTLIIAGNEDTVFYEVIHRGQFLYVSGYHKEYIKKYSASSLYGLWSRQIASHYIYTDSWQTVSSKRSFLAYFDPGTDEIKRYMRRNRIKFGKATSDQMKQLLAFSSKFYRK